MNIIDLSFCAVLKLSSGDLRFICLEFYLTYQPRNDLNLSNAGCESLFIEIPTSSGKPFITGVIYRHPTYAFQPFQDEFVNLSPTFKTTTMTI